MKNVPHKPHTPVETYLQRIRDYYAKHGVAPKSEACERGQSTNKHLVKIYGSWQKAVEAAIGIGTNYRLLTDDDVKQIVRRMRDEKGRFPHIDDFTRNDQQLIDKRFGNITLVNEATFNDSIRLRILVVLQDLSPAGVDGATTPEIHHLLNKRGYQVPVFSVRGLLEYSRKQGLISTNRLDKVILWSLTNAGKQFINQYKASGLKGKKDGDKSR
jgi:hypothetical protein